MISQPVEWRIVAHRLTYILSSRLVCPLTLTLQRAELLHGPKRPNITYLLSGIYSHSCSASNMWHIFSTINHSYLISLTKGWICHIPWMYESNIATIFQCHGWDDVSVRILIYYNIRCVIKKIINNGDTDYRNTGALLENMMHHDNPRIFCSGVFLCFQWRRCSWQFSSHVTVHLWYMSSEVTNTGRSGRQSI